jgi:wobble nucleotide-excising tRNase
MRLAEQVKVVNANAKVDALNDNVMELEGLMKGNVGKIISNMSDLETAEKKSERLSSLSMQFETDSRALEEKMKRKACVRKMLMGGGAALLLFLLYYFLF